MSKRSAEAFRLAVEAFDAKVRATPPERWSDPSPCEGWTATDVVHHCVGNLRGLMAVLAGGDFMAAREQPVDGDSVTAWADASAAALAAIGGAPAGATVEIAGNEVPFGAITDGIMRDLVIHAWDLARAVGGNEELPAEAVRHATAAMEQVGDAMRRPGGYGPVLTPPAGADDLGRLLALSGRTR